MGNYLELIETILWEEETFFLLDLHTHRLEKSALHFSIPCDTSELVSLLKTEAISFDSSQKYRIRVLLNQYGKFSLSSAVLDTSLDLPVKITFSTNTVNKNSPFLQHKTTNRELYDNELVRYRNRGFFDVIFKNQDGEITEGTISNIVICKDRKFFTPPTSCGLLPGVYREYMLRSDEFALEEKVLYESDIRNADELLVINSVRKSLPAVLEDYHPE